MMLRQRVAVTSLLVSIPATILIASAIERVRAADRELAVSRVVESQINDQVRERCESDPAWFLTGPLEGRPPGGVFIETHPDELPPRPRVDPQPFELFAYDQSLVGSSSATPRLPAEFRQRLRFRSEPVVAPHVTGSGTGVQVAMATGWTGGPCAYFLGRMEAPPHQLRQRVLTVIGVFALTFLAAMAAVAPTVRRIRRLAKDARESVDGGHTAIAPDRLADELSSLAFVLNDTSQELRERRSRIDDLDDELKRFVRTTAEDVAQPIAALEERLANASAVPSISHEHLHDALRQVHRVSGEVQNLMAVTRLRAIGPSPDTTPIDLGAIVSRVANGFAPLADVDGIALRVTLPAGPVLVNGDESLVERAVANLVDNAVRYNRRGGEVAIGLKVEGGAPRFRLWVADNGPGVTEEHFRGLTAVRRFRGDESRNRRPDAPGLGLALTREICDRFGLRFDLKRPGAGGLEAEISGPVS